MNSRRRIISFVLCAAMTLSLLTLSGIAKAEGTYDLPDDEPFNEEGIVAYVGEEGFEFLEDAIEFDDAGPENPVIIVDDIMLSGTLTVSKPVTILGDGFGEHVICSASRDTGGDLIVIESAGVRIGGYENGGLIIDGRDGGADEAVYAGSLIRVKAAGFTADNLTLRYGYTSGKNAGGALYIESAGAAFTNCTFDHNKYTCGDNDYGGGAFQLMGANGISASFTGCSFTNNYADRHGGVGNIPGRAQASFTGCSFSNNEAVKVGGVFYVGQANYGANPGMITLSGCSFAGNTAGTNGAAIRATGGFVIDGCSFAGNTANDSSTTSGGDISVGNSYMITRSVSNSDFDKKFAAAIKSSATGGLATITPEDLFMTNTFADYYIAKIGAKKYLTLSTAITAAKAGDTIELLGDCSENVSFDKRITLTGNYQLTGKVTINSVLTLDGPSIAGHDTTHNSGARSYSIRRNDAHNLLDQLPAYTGGEFVSYNIGFAEKGSIATQEVIYKGTLQSFEEYTENFDCDETGELGKLHYAHAVQGTIGVYMYYDSFTGHVKIVAEPTSLTGGFVNNHAKTGSYDPSVTMINCTNPSDTTNSKYGMGLIYQLSDGSFIIVDGGYSAEASRIYNKLVELAGGASKIKIAAWLFTHAHNDHVDAFSTFVNDHPTLLPENVIFNFVNDFEYSEANAANGDSQQERVARRDSTKTLIKNKGLNFVKAHAGENFRIGNALIEVICTTENVKPLQLLNINDTSVIYRITLCGQSTMILGDASRFTEYYLNNVFGSALASDGVTLAHHGYAGRGVTSTLYANIAPSFALWPVAEAAYNSTYAANKWVLNNVKDVYVAKDYGSNASWAHTIYFGTTVTMSASASSDFSLNFSVSDLGGFDSARLYARLGDKDAKNIAGSKSGGSFTFVYDEIYSQYMTDVLDCKVYATKRGTEYEICEFTTTLAQYIDQLVLAGTPTAAQKQFYSNILKMGAESQKYSKHRDAGDQLATYGISWLNAADLDPADTAFFVTRDVGGDAYIKGAALSVGYKLARIFYIAVPAGVSTDGLCVKIDGMQVDLADAEAAGQESLYKVTTGSLLPQNYDAAAIVTVERGGVQLASLSYSVNTYLKNKAADAGLSGLVRAIYNYGVSAKALF